MVALSSCLKSCTTVATSRRPLRPRSLVTRGPRIPAAAPAAGAHEQSTRRAPPPRSAQVEPRAGDLLGRAATAPKHSVRNETSSFVSASVLGIYFTRSQGSLLRLGLSHIFCACFSLFIWLSFPYFLTFFSGTEFISVSPFLHFPFSSPHQLALDVFPPAPSSPLLPLGTGPIAWRRPGQFEAQQCRLVFVLILL